MLIRWIAIAGLLGSVATFSPALAENVTLARVNGVPITLEDLKEDFQRRHQGHMSILSDADVVRDFLDAAIKRQLFIEEAYRLDLQSDAEIGARVAEERISAATSWIYRSEVADRVKVTDADIEAALPEATQAHEIIRIQVDSFAEAELARERIVNGEVVEQVARDVSQAKSRTRGGVEGADWGTLAPNFEAAIAATVVGEIAGPVQTDDGWELAFVIARKDVEVGTQKRSPTHIRSVLERRRTEEIRTRFLDGLRERYATTVEETLLEPAVLLPLVKDADKAAQEQRVVATFSGGRITLADFVQSLQPQTFLNLTGAHQAREAAHLLANQIDAALLRQEAIRRWDEAPAATRAEVAWFESDVVFRLLLKRVVFNDLLTTDEEVSAYLDAHHGDYMDPAKVRFGIALLATEAEATTLLADFRAGTPFAELARERSGDAATAARDGDAGWIAEGQAIEILRGAPFATPVGAAGGPIQIPTGWLVYTVFERLEATPFPQEKAYAAIRRELMRLKSEERMHHWEQQLRAVAEVKVNAKGLRRAGEILAQERADRHLEESPTAPPMRHGGAS